MPDKKPEDLQDSSEERPAEPTIEGKEELTKRIEVLMGPTNEEAPPNSATEEDARVVEPDSTPAVPDDSESESITPEVNEEQIEELAAENEDEPETPSVVAAEDSGSESTAQLPGATDDESDSEIDKAIDDIVVKEGDDILAAEDAVVAAAFVPPPKPSLKDKIKKFFSSWWHNRIARNATIAGLVVAVIATILIPPARYFVLNTAGVRASASVTVLDNSTGQPLKNVRVSLAGVTGQTDGEGNVRLERLKLGNAELVAEKRAFANLGRKVTIGWGSNPLGDFNLSPVGSQYTFVLTDFLSGKPVAKAEAVSGEASAVSDENGKIVLTVEESDEQELKVSIKAETYRSEVVVIGVNDKQEYDIKLVADRKHAFISKRSGKFDVYAIDIDGKNEQKVLSGTGNERDDMVLAIHPTANMAALVSTREGKRNKDGYLMSNLTLIDLSRASETESSAERVEPSKPTNQNTPPPPSIPDRINDQQAVDQSERIQIVGWGKEQLVFIRVTDGTSAGNPNRYKLISYNFKSEDSQELASANYFNDVTAIGEQVYYSSARYQSNGSLGFYRINADGTGRQTILAEEVWNIFRTDYDHLSLSVQQDWYDYKLGESKPTKASGSPPNLKTRVYIDSPDKQTSLWVDNRDGKGVLLAYNVTDKTEKVVRTQSGLKYPVRWLDNKTLVYRINTEQETADYALNLDGGEPVKIRDVTNTGSVDQRYYY